MIRIANKSGGAGLLDLHFSLRSTRRLNNDHTIDFDGQNHEISATLRKSVTLLHHPNLRFWVLEHPPKDIWPPFSPILLCNHCLVLLR